MWRCSSGVYAGRERIGSRRCWTKRLVAVSLMYMYSAPSVRQYVSFSAAMRSRRRIRSAPALNEPTSNSVSRSASVNP